ncbi:MAG TPA: SPOR domain-containing protein [Methylophilaceae bacterium]|nr:SPOR domain-containing protein [Methylophilaceae bacterium]
MASNQLNEQELQFKKRARRRLVGAIALVLLMVTILPMVLDDRANKEPQQEIAITIPSQDNKDFTSKVVPVPETTAPPAETPAPGEQDAAEPAVSDDSSGTAPEKEDKAPPMAQAKPEQPKAAPVKPAEASAAKEATQAKPGMHMSVQIGVFSDASNVKQLQQKLQSLGYQSYTEKIATSKGEKIRLRAGPFTSRAEAEAALAKVKSAGMTGMVVSK